MPQVIPIIVGAIASTAGLGTLAVAAWTIGASLAVGLYERDKAKKIARKAKDAYNASLQDRLITIKSAVSAVKYMVGTVRTGGTLQYADSVGPDKTSFDSVIALAGNQCDLVGYYLNDEYIAIADFPGEHYGFRIDRDESQTFTVTGPSATVDLGSPPADNSLIFVTYAFGSSTGQASFNPPVGDLLTITGLPGGTGQVHVNYTIAGADKLSIQFKDGDANQTVTDWFGTPTPLWTSAHRLRGVCHVRPLMNWDENVYQSGAPNINGVLKGKLVPGFPFYDPRTGTNPIYTDNPALWAGYWMTLPRLYGGCGIPSTWIDWDDISAAANICDELITVRQLNGVGYEQIKRYQCHCILDTENDPLSNLDIILSAMAGRRVFDGYKYRILAGAFRTATFTITDANTVGTKSIKVLTASGDDALPNVVTAKFADAHQNWVETSPKPVRNTGYITADGHEEPIPITLPATTDSRQANYLMGVALERARPAFGLTIWVDGIGEDMRCGDTCQLSLTNRSAYSGKTFEIVKIEDPWDGNFGLTLNEVKATTYALDADRFTPINPPAVADNSFLWNIPQLTSFDAVIGTPQTLPDGTSISSVQLSWLPPSEYVAQGGRIEVRYRESGGEWIGVAPVGGDSTGTTVSASLINHQWYLFQARAVNGLGSFAPWVGKWCLVAGVALSEGVQGPGIFTWAGASGADTTPSSIIKTAASGTWNAGAYSLQSYSVGCFVSARPGQTNTAKMIGLNDDPAVNQDFTTINYAWRADATGNLQMFENGAQVATAGTYTTSTILSITYDGANVRYFKDGVVQRTVAATGLRLFLDASMFTIAGSWLDVTFGPQGGAGAAGAAGAPGAAGAAAQAVRLSATAQVFTFDSAGAASPGGQVITFTAVRQNIPAAATWTTTPSIALGGAADTRTIAIAAMGVNTSVKVRAEASGFFDEITIVRLQQGAAGANGQAAITGLLTNEAHTLAADPDGVVGSYSGASGLFFLFEGLTDRTSLATFSIVSSVGCSAEINTATNTPVAGQPRGFYRVTAVTADQASVTLRAVYNTVTVDKVFTVVRARQGAPGDGSNLLQISDWMVGTTGSQGTPVRWTQNGLPTENAIVLGGAGTAPLGPLGNTEPLWECRPSGDNNADGGYDYASIPVTGAQSYRSVIWVRITERSGGFYHGCSYTQTYNLGGTANSDPYFIGGAWNGALAELELNQWYMSVGIIHGSGYAGGYSGIGGIYDPRTGKRVIATTEFRMAPGATTQIQRVYNYFSPSSTQRQWHARPRFEEINGNEPSIYDLMGIRLPTPWIERGNSLASPTSFFKSGGTTAWDSDVYSVQSFSACHLQFHASQASAYLMLGLNSDPLINASWETLDFAFYCQDGGNWDIRESGNAFLSGAYTKATEFGITYDGANVRYYVDRVLVRTSAIVGARFYLDSSLYTPGGAFSGVKWGPGVEFENVTTGEIEPGAIGEQYYSSLAGPITNSASQFNPGGTSPNIHSFSYTPQVAGVSWITIDFNVFGNQVSGDSGAISIWVTQNGITQVTVLDQNVPTTVSPMSKTAAASVVGGAPVTVMLRSKCTYIPTIGGQSMTVSAININVRHYKR